MPGIIITGIHKGHFIGLLRNFVLLALVVHLIGCAALYVLPETERAAVSAGGKTIVLLRIECTVDDQSCEPFGTSAWKGEPVVALGMGSFETVGEPRPEVHRFLSEESRRTGWTYFVLSSGVYYLAVLGPESDAYLKTFREAPRWRIDIPEKTRFLYAGTLRIRGKTIGRFLFGGKNIKPVNEDLLILKDEHELANSLLAQLFADSGETKTMLMQRWRQGDPIIIRSPREDSKK